MVWTLFKRVYDFVRYHKLVTILMYYRTLSFNMTYGNVIRAENFGGGGAKCD